MYAEVQKELACETVRRMGTLQQLFCCRFIISNLCEIIYYEYID